jgi:glycine cleavage system transcriptional repressor
MAIFGSEFTFIMLLNGDTRAINRIEARIPKIAHSLDLITMMKRTSGHRTFDLVKHYEAEYSGIDQPGILKAMTAFFATRKIDISSLKSEINLKTNHMSANILFALTEKISIDELEHDFLELCQQTNIQGFIKKANGNLL